MEPVIEERLAQIVPQIACDLIQQPDMPLGTQPTILSVLDILNEGLMGWVPGLGAGGEKLHKKFQESVTSIMKSETDIPSLMEDLDAFMTKESNRIEKLEQRMAASETGLMRSQQSKILAANMINQATKDKQVTGSLLEFLHGPWYDSVQLLVIEKGLDSEEWQRAEKLTETLIWTFQPIDPEVEDIEAEKQRLYRIIEHLPDEIKQILVALKHDEQAADNALNLIEADQVMIVSGQNPTYVVFDPIPCEESTSNKSNVSRILLRKVNALETGQWFIYADNETSIRIKLVLKLEDVKQLLFTDRNGMKVLQKSFDEFAYYLSSHIVKPLNQESVFSSTFKTYYEGLITEFEKYKKMIAERRVEVDLMDEERKHAREKALKEAHDIERAREMAEKERLAAEKSARLEAARSEAEKPENVEHSAELTSKVLSLNTGALLQLPGADGTLEDCKLAVKIAAIDKMIFVTRSGTKIGEYNSAELVQLIIAGQARINDEGVEFEDTLAQVVSRLRKDRGKSYGDLTGE